MAANSDTRHPHDWLSVHIYYAEPWEALLVNGVKPFVESLLEKKQITQFFFVRYHEKGPHIRLRLKGTANTVDQTVKDLLIRHFEKYFFDHPSTEGPASTHFPNNSLQFIEYEPEYERYGGEKGIAISEKQFFISSIFAIRIMHQNRDWDYHQAIGFALMLNLVLSISTGIRVEDISHFFDYLCTNRIIATLTDQTSLTEQELNTGLQKLTAALDASFQDQKPAIFPILKKNWEPFHANEKFVDETYTIWLALMKEIVADLSACSIEAHLKWSIYDSYAHMTNNRLGILNWDECLIYYILKEFFKEI